MAAPVSIAVPIGHDLITTLGMQPGLFIKQHATTAEALGICVEENMYDVEPWDPLRGREDGEAKKGRVAKGQPLFFLKEKSDWCERQGCYNGRSFTMAMTPSDPRIPTSSMVNRDDPFLSPDAIIFERPFKCTFFCWNRDKMRIKHPQMGYLGELYNPFTWCHHIFEIRTPTPCSKPTAAVSEWAKSKGPAGTVLYRIRGNICQWGLWAPPLPCGNCSRVVFTIHDAKDTTFQHPIGNLQNVFAGFCNELIDAGLYRCTLRWQNKGTQPSLTTPSCLQTSTP